MRLPVELMFLITLTAAGQGEPGPLRIRIAPERPIIETGGASQLLNFDIVLLNTGSVTLRLAQLELSVYGRDSRLVMQKSLNRDAFAPSMEVIGQQTIRAHATLDIFNPFYQFDASLPLDKLRFTLCLQNESTPQEEQDNHHRLPGDCDLQQTVSVLPRVYKDKTVLSVPLRKTVFVWEGHDFYSHHLRVPLGSAAIQAMGITANSNQFADDFIYVNQDGKAYHDNPQKLENWYGYDQPVYAPGDGLVVAAVNDVPENWFENSSAKRIGHPDLSADKDPKGMGNFVLIDHQDGEWSLLLHMRPGTVKVKEKQFVKRGELIGHLRFSGDAIFPHLHYTLMDGPTPYTAWGLPAYFIGVRPSSSRLNQPSSLESGQFVLLPPE